MTHKLIKTDNYLLVVDDSEIKEGDCYLSPSGIWFYNNLNPNHSKDCNKVIAHLSLNGSPILEGVDLLPALGDVKQIVEEEYSRHVNNYGLDSKELQNAYKAGIWDGYNKAREKYKYTLSDIEAAVAFGMSLERFKDDEHKLSDDAEFKGFIQSLHQYPTEFISDDEISHQGSGTYSTDLMDIGVSNLKPIKVPKTITTAQGIQWVGKYK